MIRHIVMWKLKDFAEKGTKAENAVKIKEGLEALVETIKEIRGIEVGIDMGIEKSDMVYDVVLYSEFENEEDLARYQKHPEHQKVAQFIGKVKEKRTVVDYRS